MKEVKLVKLDELSPKDYWFSNKNAGGRSVREAAQKNRPIVEERLADLLNEGWQIEGAGGQNLLHAFIILVRER